MNHPLKQSLLVLALAGACASLSGCFPLVMGSAVTGVMVASDRRTSGTVVEDSAIQVKAHSRIDDIMGERAHVNVTSYNRQVLLTGEVASEQDKQDAAYVAAAVENVRGVNNELAVAGISTFSQRSTDVLVGSRVKAGLIDAKDLTANAFKVVTERGIVYLLGRVTQREAARATEIASQTDGVQRVVRIFEIISEDELLRVTTVPASEPKK